MAEDDAEPQDGEQSDEAPKKKGKGMLFGIVGALVLGGGGFFAVYSGMILGHSEKADDPVQAFVASTLPTFVPVEPLVISLGSDATSRHLKFAAELEVTPEYKEEVTALMPRVLDILNTFLRAVEDRDIESPTSMTKLRAQMLRRVQVVTGEGRVRDLLITEFVLN